MTKVVRALSILLIFSFALPAYAQIGAEPLTISISPDYPRPYQTVTVTPLSNLIDLAASTITVSVNGVVVHRGSGGESVNVRVGGPGSATTIVVTATNSGKSYQATQVIRPADVALVVEPFTTKHPFYRGGTPVASEGTLRLVAVPEFRSSSGRIAPGDLVYNWKLGDQQLQAQSGIGKSVLTAIAPVRYRDTVVTLTVTTQDSSIVASAQANVAPVEPLIRTYAEDPLLGPMFDTALSGNLLMETEEQTFRAVPYFFSGAPVFTWLVNGAASGADRSITLRSSGNGEGTASLTASAKLAKTFETAQQKFTVKFGKAGGLGIFGL